MDRRIDKKRLSWWKYVMGLIVVISVFYFLGLAFIQGEGDFRNVDVNKIVLDTVLSLPFQEYVPINGVVLPVKNVLIGAVEGGRVEEKFVENGSFLDQGQPILRMSNTDLELGYLNQEASIVSQMNQIRNLNVMSEANSLRLMETSIDVDYRIALLSKRLRRNKKLYEDEVISLVEYEDTKDEYESLVMRKELLNRTLIKDSLSSVLQQDQMNSSIDLMERNLVIAKRNLNNLIIRAPISGQLSGLNSELGELIIQGAQIGQIDDLSTFRIRVKIDEYYISRIFLHQKGSIEYDGINYALRIRRIYPEVIKGSFEADLEFIDTVPTGIKRGQNTTVRLELSLEGEAILVPKGSFMQSSGGQWIFVVGKNGNSASRREIKVGRQNPMYLEILDGLESGDVVITSRYEELSDSRVLRLKK